MKRTADPRGVPYFTRDPSVPEPEQSASSLLGIPYDAQFEQYYEKDYQDSGFTLPWSKYIGPGNSLNLGEPRTDADKIAKLHDLRYAHASYRYSQDWVEKERFEELIQEADADFVNEQKPYFPQGAHSWSGITIKQILEQIYGQLYPGSEKNPDKYEQPSDIDINLLGKNVKTCKLGCFSRTEISI